MADAPRKTPPEIAPGVPRVPKLRAPQQIAKVPAFKPKAAPAPLQGLGPVNSRMGTAANIVQGPQQMAREPGQVAPQLGPVVSAGTTTRVVVAQGARQLASGGAPAPVARSPFGILARLMPRVQLASRPPAPAPAPAPPSSGEPPTTTGKAKKGGK